jgi:hypothetical protein
MRDNVIAYLKTISLGSFAVSDELPRDESGTPLFVKNQKRLYTTAQQQDQTPLLRTLNGSHINLNTKSVSVVFSTDAKQLPANYDELVSLIRAAETIKPELGFNDRNSEVITETEDDLLITTVILTYTKIR